MGWLKNWLTGTDQHIIITGMPGVGKTVLFDYIGGKGFNKSYKRPIQSEKPESGRLLFQAGKSAISVFPGEKGIAEINKKNNALIKKHGAPQGVIHVVCNGLPEIRNSVVRQEEIEKYPTIKSYQHSARTLEVKDLDKVLTQLEILHDEDNKPTWMLVAVSKCDLYGDELGEVKKLYDPAGAGPFVSRLKKFKDEVTGPRKFRWSARPVCSRLDPFEWGSERLLSQVTESQRDKMVDDFLEHLGSY